MDLPQLVLLVAAGIGGGIISAIVGGAAIVMFPALLAAGLPAVLATAAITVSLTPGLFTAAIYDRSQLPRLDRAFLLLALVSAGGGLLGAMLLMLTPYRLFEGLVPLLLGLATALFAGARRIGQLFAARGPDARAPERGDARDAGRTLAALLPVSVYGGYFGAGVGVLFLGVFSIATRGDFRSANALKNLVAALNSLAATAIFVVQDAVVWSATLLLIAGVLLGSLIGARLAALMPNNAARGLVICAGTLLTAVYAWRYWL